MILSCVDDDKLLKNGPIRLRQEIVHPRRILKLEEGKREDSKLTKVREEKHIGKK
jgi:hypothetical protein